ncbi:hypothetical protein MAR_000157 [Mya arenaria]|uniref:Uncharacterized protein n=1 Tax=Mya arenaria TaxID=6604 RepID=A0ABY7FBY6_MYAAR|nr:hypothetical protein MAR_000157 [Mya arenaria]
MFKKISVQNWHLILPTVLMAMKSNPNTETSGFSPFKMLFGGEMRLPDTLKMVHGTAKSNTEITEESHDIKAKESMLGIGETVLRKIHKPTTGLSKKT